MKTLPELLNELGAAVAEADAAEKKAKEAQAASVAASSVHTQAVSRVRSLHDAITSQLGGMLEPRVRQ